MEWQLSRSTRAENSRRKRHMIQNPNKANHLPRKNLRCFCGPEAGSHMELVECGRRSVQEKKPLICLWYKRGLLLVSPMLMPSAECGSSTFSSSFHHDNDDECKEYEAESIYTVQWSKPSVSKDFRAGDGYGGHIGQWDTARIQFSINSNRRSMLKKNMRIRGWQCPPTLAGGGTNHL